MELSRWPAQFFERKAGVGCPHCLEGRPSETEHGVRFHEGTSTDGYLQRRAPTPGYAVVVFRERHAPDLHAMTTDELTRFWSEVATVARAIETVFDPVHLNVQVLGNAVPHVHAHVVCRYDPDPAPSMPLPAGTWGEAVAVVDVRAEVERLRAVLTDIR